MRTHTIDPHAPCLAIYLILEGDRRVVVSESSGSADRTRRHLADVQHGSAATAPSDIDSHRSR